MGRLLFFLVIFNLNIFAQFYLSAKNVGLAESSLFDSTSIGFVNNPSVLSLNKKEYFAFSFTPDYFDLNELQNFALSTNLTILKHRVGLSINYLGFDKYFELKTNLVFCKQFNNLILGLNANLTHYYIENSSPKNILNFNLGFIYKISNVFKIAFVSNNLLSVLTPVNYFSQNFNMNAGINYKFKYGNLFFLFAFEENYKPTEKFGIEIPLIQAFTFRIGKSFSPSIYSFGFTLRLNQFSIDYGTLIHTYLSNIHSLTLAYSF